MALVLIVDDSPTDVHVMQQALEQHGFRTAAAADGGEGLRLARELPAPEIALLALLEVIFGVLLAWAGAGEVPSDSTLAGGALVLGALAANHLAGRRA